MEKLRCETCTYKSETIEHCHLCSYNITNGDTLEEKMETKYDCEECGQEWRKRMQDDCTDCGDGLYWEDQEVCLLGLDVVALSPSMQSATTGMIVREHVLKAHSKLRGSIGARGQDISW